MAISGYFKLLVSLSLCARYASATSSLYVPGFDPQPITVNELGVGSDGATTYIIAPGVTSGTLDQYGIFGPATLVEASATASLYYEDPSIGAEMSESCQINNGIAVCVDGVAVPDAYGIGGYTTTYTVEEVVQSFAIQGGGKATGTAAIATTPTSTPYYSTSFATAGTSDGGVWGSGYASYGTVPTASVPTADSSSSDADTSSTGSSMTRVPVSSTAAPSTTSGVSQDTKNSGVGKLSAFPLVSLLVAGSSAILMLG
ncbi:hypothetical protein WOLCODRAFT_22946 [Wolfiporia cocos MD-104 SS10]|uniref:Uncharacterized protein n=1 Tax=Wolfiporia cocos (strain MD-104) TaxID=742152 RepID=A0A2H3J6P0_WOLCO|nr:hypothetical protein WOLCODRAFT_22946 [Wolfiporia cocos MD-104 SS10]